MPKMAYCGSKFPKIAKRWGSAQRSPCVWRMEDSPPNSSSGKMTIENGQHPTTTELLVDAGAWQFWGKIKLLTTFYFLPLPPFQKTFPRHWRSELFHESNYHMLFLLNCLIT